MSVTVPSVSVAETAVSVATPWVVVTVAPHEATTPAGPPERRVPKPVERVHRETVPLDGRDERVAWIGQGGRWPGWRLGPPLDLAGPGSRVSPPSPCWRWPWKPAPPSGRAASCSCCRPTCGTRTRGPSPASRRSSSGSRLWRRPSADLFSCFEGDSHAAVRAALGGPTGYLVAVTVRNISAETLFNVALAGYAGRSRADDAVSFRSRRRARAG